MTQPVTLQWLGGEHGFALKMGQLRALQDRCNSGPEEILIRISDGTWRIDDLFEVLRLGLIGGEMDPEAATNLVDNMMSRHALLEFKVTARAILAVALVGPGDDPVGEPEGARAAPENGVSAGSTAPGP